MVQIIDIFFSFQIMAVPLCYASEQLSMLIGIKELLCIEAARSICDI